VSAKIVGVARCRRTSQPQQRSKLFYLCLGEGAAEDAGQGNIAAKKGVGFRVGANGWTQRIGTVRGGPPFAQVSAALREPVPTAV
jgi:hypothetical protein